ncbi:MAG: hypothetical protein E7169_01010 [Firmicutes bacterium]|nr:hypothetical protein [Bacillota bacterium]
MKQITLKDIIKIIGIGTFITLIIGIFCLIIINKQTKNTVKEMANKVLTASDYYIANQMLENNLQEVTIYFPDNDTLKIQGNLPKEGYIKIYNNHQTEMKFYHKGYCVTKKTNENNFKIEKTKKKEC